jgi:hypothetical protein
MLQRSITPELSSQIIDMLIKKREWSMTKIAKRINASREYVARVHRAAQNFEFADVESLARACRQETHLFVFEAMQPEKMSAEQRGLYELTRKLIDSHHEFVRVLRRKPKKQRRSRAKAA